MSFNFWLTEEQFGKIKPLLPNKPRGVPRVDDRRVPVLCIPQLPVYRKPLPATPFMAGNGGGWIVKRWVFSRTVREFDRPPSSHEGLNGYAWPGHA